MYALYHGDVFIDLGTKEYLANIIGVSVRTIEFYMSPIYKKRNNIDNCYIVIKIEE